MRDALPPSMQHELPGRVEEELGLHFQPRQWKDLRRGVAAAAASLGLRDADLARRIVEGVATEDEWRALAGVLAIGETYFFRDTEFFGCLAGEVLPALVEARRHTSRSLRIWSVGCSSGEEPYSIAMLLAGLLPDWREWDICILGTDLRAGALAKARAGVYGAWSLRGGVPAQAREFLQSVDPGRHEVDPAIRALARFEQLNLARDAYPSAHTGTVALDLVVCRNVLMYFRPDRAHAIAQRLARCLGDGGWLMTNALEVPAGGVPGLAPVPGLPAAAFRRTTHAPAAAARPETPGRSVEPIAFVPAALAVRQPVAHAAPAVDRPERAAAADSPGELAVRARELANAGDLASAAALCRSAIDRDKLNPEWTYLLALVLQEGEALGEAEAALRRTLYLDPGHVLGRIAMANLAIRQGGAGRARQHFTVALDRLSRLPAGEVLPNAGGITAQELVAAIRGFQGRDA